MHIQALRLGLHAEAISALGDDSNNSLFLPGVDVSATFPLTRKLNDRIMLSADFADVNFLRLDDTLLSKGDTYFGAGFGSGIFFGDYVYASPAVWAST